MTEETKAQQPPTEGKFARFRLPPQAGGGEIVMRVLTAGEVDEVLELDDVPGTDILAELAVESLYSLQGEVFPKGVPGVARYRSLGSKRRTCIQDAYNHLHNMTKAEHRHLKRSIAFEGSVASFAVPITGADGKVVDGPRFTMRELAAGQVDDALRGALDGRSPIAVTNQLVLEALVTADGSEVAKGDGGLRWLAGLSNKRRTVYSAAYAFLHDNTQKETSTFLGGCEALDAPPKAI